MNLSYVTDPSKRQVKLSILLGIITGIIGGFAKWGWEVPFPPRDPNIFWPIGELSRVTPPKVFLDMLGLPSDWTYVFSGVSQPLSVFIVHVSFSLVFALFYCIVSEYWPCIKIGQGMLFGFLCYIGAHVIVMPLIGLVPPLVQIPFDEQVSELFGHLWWLWIIEVARRDLRNRITGKSDPEKQD